MAATSCVTSEELSKKLCDGLSHQELQLFELLCQAGLRTDLPGANPTICRVAGGWVRDRILGVPSDDIDIAVDNTTGLQFARNVNAELVQQGHPPAKIAIIAAQPDKGKNLETATLHLFGTFDVDFVHLRSPERGSALGTPEQDAKARDLTINSLFFNLNTRQIEDWNGTGLSDLLHDRLIRTPVSPLKTFHDDPLRMIRALRFANRYNFTLDPLLSEALLDADTRRGLVKISRERFTTELDSILNSPSPLVALRLLVDHSLFGPVFLAGAVSWKGAGLDGVELGSRGFAHLEVMHNRALSELFNDQPTTDRKICYLAALLEPVYRCACPSRTLRATRDLLAQLIKPAMMLTNSEEKALFNLFLHFNKLVVASRSTVDCSTGEWRTEVGMTIRSLGDQLWKDAVRLAFVVDAVASGETDCVLAQYRRFIGNIFAADLHTAKKPLITGQNLFDLLPSLSPGPQVHRIIELQLEWMYAHPDLGLPECSAYLQSLR